MTARLALLYLLITTSPAQAVDCGRVIMAFNFRAEDLKTSIMQSDAIVTQIQATPNSPPQRVVLDWLVPFVQSIEMAKSLLVIHRLAPECFNISTRDIENGIADRERILNTVANIVRGNLRGLKPP